jgi:hypothetical protein
MIEASLKSRERALARWKALQTDRQQGWDGHWRAVATNLLPRHSRFLTTERNKGGDRNQSIIDSHGTGALRVLSAGMMAGMTSPARPWFRLSLPDEKLADQYPVKVWLNDTTDLLLRVFNKSNTYNMLHMMYRELGGFGTGLNIIRPNFERVIHNSPMTVGEYALGLNDEGYVDKVGRQFKLTVEQAAEWFGLENLSVGARNAYANSNYNYEVEVIHLIEPNADRKPGQRGPGNMPYKSVYWDYKARDTGEGLLSQGGFRKFPALAPRWDVLWNDTYGSSPGMEALGDLLQLQHEQGRKGKAIDYQTDPPLQVPVSLRSQNADFLPGGISYYDAMQPQGGIRTAFDVNLDVGVLLEDIRDVRQRIDSAFYVDMFLMLAQDDKTMTATEVAERHEEKLLMLGPVLERLHNELLEPLVVFAFERCMEAGILPPVPEELHGIELQIEFVSTIAQAQKAVSVNSVDRLLGHVGMLTQLKGDSSPMDKIDLDKSIDRYADQLGVDPDLIVPGEKVALIRQQRAQAQQAAANAEQAAKVAGAAKDLGSVQTGSAPQENAASDIIGLFSGYNSPTTTEQAA